MSDILVVTDRGLCRDDFLCRIEALAAAHPHGLILREKDLSAEDYKALAVSVLARCERHGVSCILHSHPTVALSLGLSSLHMPLPLLRRMSAAERAKFTCLGASCHSPEEAREAQALGCTYITAGHIFATDCKKGLPGRGLDFLREVCRSVSIPVYAIGGITAADKESLFGAGAAGACVMSGAMQCKNAADYLAAFERET